MTVVGGMPTAGYATRPRPIVGPAWPGSRLRWVPPAHSPLPANALALACAEALADACLPWRDARRRLARALCIGFDAARAELFASGTQALAAAIRVATARSGSRLVALPVYGCYDIGAAALEAGASIIPYDLDPDTLAPDLGSFEMALRHGARAAVVAPLWGFPPPWDALRALATAHGATLVEDAAQGIGSTWRDRAAGSIADISVVSFGRGKGWTGGSGGALLLRGVGAASMVPPRAPGPPLAGLSAAIRVVAQAAFAHPLFFALPASLPFLHVGDTVYRECGAAREMAAFAARVVRRTVRAAWHEGVVRRRNARAYSALIGLAGARGLVRTVRTVEGAVPGYLRFPLRLADGAAAATEAARRSGVARGYPRMLVDVAPIAGSVVAEMRGRAWAGGGALVREVVTLPTHSLAAARDRALALDLALGGG